MREVWDSYITEAAWRNPRAGRDYFLAERLAWHRRQGLTDLFPFPWGEGEAPVMGDPFSADS